LNKPRTFVLKNIYNKAFNKYEMTAVFCEWSRIHIQFKCVFMQYEYNIVCVLISYSYKWK
jgi:hypothetical protein